MARTLVFRMVVRKLSEITINKPILSQYSISFNYKCFFFQSVFDLFSIIAKEVSQIRNNAVCVVARLVFLFCCALTTGCCNTFQHIFHKLKEIGVFRPIFPVYVISCDYDISSNFQK